MILAAGVVLYVAISGMFFIADEFCDLLKRNIPGAYECPWWPW